MHDTEAEESRDSTADDDRRRLRWRFFGSLVLIGLMVGMMLGRLTAPGPIELLGVEEIPSGLVLWFDREPVLREETAEGLYALHIAARGAAQKGQLRSGDGLVNWRLRSNGETLTLLFVAARPLLGQSDGLEQGGRWRLQVALRAP